MHRPSWNKLCLIVIIGGALATSVIAEADPIYAVQVLRAGGCGGTLPAAHPLQRNSALDRAAEQWAAGRKLATALESSGYRADMTSAVHISGPEASAMSALRQANCRSMADPALHDIGIYRRGFDSWIVLASTYSPPTGSEAPLLAMRTLQLINAARARGTRCGGRAFAPAPAVALSTALAGVAFAHAEDMAEHNYFEHQDRSGRTPADRVRAVGYPEKLVGENIAYGPRSAEEVVQGWLDSPGHCENIMDPRFAEMGIAYAAGRSSKSGLYWVQLLVEPRS